MKLEILEKINDSDYNEIVDDSKKSTFYTSYKFLEFIKENLKIKPSFIVSYEKSKINGVFPFFIKEGEYGKVINSLPFFGSYGGIISENTKIDKAIITEFNNYNKKNDVLSSVIIDNPFCKNEKIYSQFFNCTDIENRLIQSIILNSNSNEIWNNFEKRTRWSVRKSEKNNVEIIKFEHESEELENFYNLHLESMKKKNGRPKPKKLFSLLTKNFVNDRDYNIFIAKKDGRSISYILVFYYKNFSEYYLPAYDPNYLPLQSTSYLIWKSIQESIKRKIKFYNFGGTWKTQKELYLFKRGWNATDYNYKYFIFKNSELINSIGLEKILEKYQYFYISPIN